MENSKKEDIHREKVFISVLIAIGFFAILTPVVLALYLNSDTTHKSAVSEQGINIAEVAVDDKIRGSEESEVKIVSYSDFYCPFCKQFHNTLNILLSEYQVGELALVYRHWPGGAGVPEESFIAATASECVARAGGNDAFWKFADLFYERVKRSEANAQELSLEVARDIGLEVGAIEVCLSEGGFDELIDSQSADALTNGAGGTPWSVVVAPDGNMYPIRGAQSIQTVRQIIDLALEK